MIAVIFDFDDTLMPDSTSALLRAHDIDETDFWARRAKELIDIGYDPPMAYLNLILRETRGGGALQVLTNADLKAFGAKLDDQWFPGLPAFFDDLRAMVSENHRDITVEYYIISGGLLPVIEGISIVSKYFTGVYACQFGVDARSDEIIDVQRCITFTEKTRYLFEISKGIPPALSRTQSHLVNQAVQEVDRRIPLRNMIYVGDGLTDVPCFSVVEKGGGVAYGILKSGQESAKQVFQQFLASHRVRSVHSPDYGEGADLGKLLRATVATKAAEIALASQRVFGNA